MNYLVSGSSGKYGNKVVTYLATKHVIYEAALHPRGNLEDTYENWMKFDVRDPSSVIDVTSGLLDRNIKIDVFLHFATTRLFDMDVTRDPFSVVEKISENVVIPFYLVQLLADFSLFANNAFCVFPIDAVNDDLDFQVPYVISKAVLESAGKVYEKLINVTIRYVELPNFTSIRDHSFNKLLAVCEGKINERYTRIES